MSAEIELNGQKIGELTNDFSQKEIEEIGALVTYGGDKKPTAYVSLIKSNKRSWQELPDEGDEAVFKIKTRVDWFRKVPEPVFFTNELIVRRI